MSTPPPEKMRGIPRDEAIDERLHYMRLKATALRKSPQDDFQNTLIVSGSARSDISWITQLLNHRQEYRELVEPFSESLSSSLKEFKTETFYTLDTNNSALTAEIATALLGGVHTSWNDKKHGDPRGTFRIIKDIRLGFALPWILASFPKVRAIHILRHPFAVYQSCCQLTFNYRQHLNEVFTRNPDLASLCPIARVTVPKSNLATFVLYWCLENFFILKFANLTQCHLSIYEEFFINRLQFLEGLQRVLPELNITPIVDTGHAYNSSCTGVAPSPSLVNYYYTKTLRENSEAAVNEALNILALFKFDALYSESPFPKKGGLAASIQSIQQGENGGRSSCYTGSRFISENTVDAPNCNRSSDHAQHQQAWQSSILKRLTFYRFKIRRLLRDSKPFLIGNPLSIPKHGFLRYRRNLARTRAVTMNFEISQQAGLVSIIVPVYNGEQYLRECLDSIFAQTYTDIEIIAVNDGSTDSSLAILKEYAQKHANMLVISQENQKLPAALNTGSAKASGEFITWTSADNRLDPDFIETFANQLKQDRHLAMIYGSYRLIDQAGKPLKRHRFWIQYQSLLRTDHVILPGDSLALNTVRGNTIGPTFMYRAKDAFLCGEYSRMRTGLEDVDFFKRINSIRQIRRSETKRVLTSYRIHAESMSATMHTEIKYALPQSEVFDDFRRDSFIAQSAWILESKPGCTASLKLREEMSSTLHRKGDLVLSRGDVQGLCLPKTLAPIGEIFIDLTSDNPQNHFTATHFSALVTSVQATPMQGSTEPGLLSIGYGEIKNSSQKHDCYSSDIASIVDVIFYRQRAFMFSQWEHALAFESHNRKKTISVIICTYNRPLLLKSCLESVLLQTFNAEDYEIIVVNNSSSSEAHSIVRKIDNPRNVSVTVIDCPLAGLSNARNFGSLSARGKFLCFIDDDAVAANDWLHHIALTFQNPSIGCVGGPILLQVPPSSELSEAVINRFNGTFSHFEPQESEILTGANIYRYPWGANFSITKEAFLATGGFRTSFGRYGQGYAGGEELVMSAALNHIGYRVAINREAMVFHFVEQERFTKKHIYLSRLAGFQTLHAISRTGYRAPKWSLSRVMRRWGSSLVKKLYYSYGRDCDECKKIEVHSEFLNTTFLLKILLKEWYERYYFSKHRDISRIGGS